MMIVVLSAWFLDIKNYGKQHGSSNRDITHLEEFV